MSYVKFLEECSREGKTARENDLDVFVEDKKTMHLCCSREEDGLREDIRRMIPRGQVA